MIEAALSEYPLHSMLPSSGELTFIKKHQGEANESMSTAQNRGANESFPGRNSSARGGTTMHGSAPEQKKKKQKITKKKQAVLELDFSGPQWPRRLSAQAASMLQLSRLRTEAVGVLPSLPWLPSLFSIWTAPTYFFSWTLRTSFSLEDKIEEAGSSEDQGQRIERAVRKSQRTPSTILFFFTKRGTWEGQITSFAVQS